MSETLRKLTRTTVKVGVLGAGILMIGSSAQAADVWNTGFNQGALNGNQIKLPVQVPINVCGVAVGILAGGANASCVGGASAEIESARAESTNLDWTTGFNQGLLNGNQIYAPIQIPINVCGIAVGALIGGANASCVGGASATIDGGDDHHYDYGYDHDASGTWDKKATTKKGKESDRTEVLGSLTSALPLGALTGGLGGAPAAAPAAPAAKAAPAKSAKGDWGYGHDDAKKSAKGDWGYGHDDTKKSAKGDWGYGHDDTKKSAKGDWGYGHDDTKKSAKGDWGYGDAKSNDSSSWGYGHDDTCSIDLTSGFNQGALNGNQLVVPIQVPIDISGIAVGAGLGGANASSVGGSSASFC